jgi:multidrug resistance efflux pump
MLVITFLFLSPFIRFSLSIHGDGIIRPITEKTEVKIFTSDIVDKIYIVEGEFINKGDPILKLQTERLLSKINFYELQKSEIESYIIDLSTLVKDFKNAGIFESLLYKQEYYAYIQINKALNNKLEKIQLDYNRSKKLFDMGIIAAKEFEDVKFSFVSAQNDLNISFNNQIAKWNTDLSSYQLKLNEINIELNQLLSEIDYYTVYAPVSGYIDEFSGIYAGNILRAGETVAIISPDSMLIAEIYLNSKDIGYLRKDSKVRIHLDAFNYNEWGEIKGDIINVSSDFIMINNSPMYRIRCSLENNYLTLNNGIRGYIKKGMTIRANFTITERSLLQLLYQRIDKWLNPTQSSKVQSVSNI